MPPDANELILMAHVVFGMACVLSAMWLAFLVGGYWYVVFYRVDKAIILKGPWPFAHSFFMETKEHLVILLLLLASYLPIVAANNLAASRDARRVVLWVTGLMVLMALMMDGDGAIIAMGVKVGLLPK
jgi:hypothetical protein